MHAVVVLPTYNEVENIAVVIDGLLALNLVEASLDVLVVDDSSPDGTGAMVKEIADQYPPGRISLLTRPRPEGLGVAYRAGFAWALDHDYEVVVQMDSDGSHPVAVVGALLQAIASGADLALGARYIPGGGTDPNWAWHRKVLSTAGNTYARLVLSLPYKDLTGGFKAWRADLLRAIVPIGGNLSGYAFQIHTTYVAHLQGASIAEVPFTFKERMHGASKMRSRIIVEGLWAIIGMRTQSTPAVQRSAIHQRQRSV